MLDSLIQAVTRFTEARPGEGPYSTAIDGVHVLRADGERRPNPTLHRPALCVVLQGSKWTMFGDRRFDYRAGQALVISLNMPALGRVVEASPDAPFLGLVVELDVAIMREVASALDAPPPARDDVPLSVFVTDFDEPLIDCMRRTVRLFDTPNAIPILYPAIMREICYWLLTGPHGDEVYRIAQATGPTQGVLDALTHLRRHFTEPIRIEALARTAMMSPSAFHLRFKAITGMTPLQYQKQLRLLEARRRLVATDANVAEVAHQVGYESASQFSREYTRTFGTPPRRDAAAITL